MDEEHESEIEQILDPAVKEFAETISGLHIPKDAMQGVVALGGPGISSPERYWPCQPPYFRDKKQEIEYLLLIDKSGTAGNRISRTAPYDRFPQPNQQAYTVEQDLVPFLLERFPKSIHTLTTARWATLESQLPKLLPAVNHALEPGGYYIGSGGFKSEDQLAELLIQDDVFKVHHKIKLPSKPGSGYNFTGQHLGFVAQRI